MKSCERSAVLPAAASPPASEIGGRSIDLCIKSEYGVKWECSSATTHGQDQAPRRRPLARRPGLPCGTVKYRAKESACHWCVVHIRPDTNGLRPHAPQTSSLKDQDALRGSSPQRARRVSHIVAGLMNSVGHQTELSLAFGRLRKERRSGGGEERGAFASAGGPAHAQDYHRPANDDH